MANKDFVKEKFSVLFLEEAIAFIENLDEKARKKIIYNIRKAQAVNDPELFKKLTENVWEFRTLYGKTHFRLFAFWDKTGRSEVVVISTHGLIKKTGKTPQGEIEKTERLRSIYFEQKH